MVSDQPTNGEPNKPRHLEDITAMMPAVRMPPRHAAPDTNEMQAVKPAVPPVTPQEARENGGVALWAWSDGKMHAEPEPVKKTPWWKRLLGNA